MARIPMRSGWTLIPEGVYVFHVEEVKYDEDFGKIELKLVTVDGKTHNERYSLKNNDDTWNERALNAFSFFAKNVLNDFSREDIDPNELKGHYIRAEVVHNKSESKKEPGKMLTFVNLGDKSPADGFDGETVSVQGSGDTETDLDLDDLLG